MLDAAPNDPDAHSNRSADPDEAPQVEWIPVMLRPLPTASVVVYCIVLIASLELLNDMPSTRDGISTTHKSATQVVTYLPTVLVVLLGIFWRRLIVDLKRIMPWACLSRAWTLGKNSLELNYLDDLELLLIWPAARRRHWALLLALLGGLVSGGLVPLAAALTYVDLAGQSTRHVLVRNDVFNFDNTLSDSNASLSLLKSYSGGLPWAGAASILQSYGTIPAWTADSFVFAPFHSSETDLSNHTLTANTTAITARFQCDSLQVDASVGSQVGGYSTGAFNVAIYTDTMINVTLTPTDDPSSQSSQAVLKDPDSIIDPPVAWLNLSSSSSEPTQPADSPIQMTLLQPLSNAGRQLFRNGTSDGRLVPVRTYRGIGLSCVPLFYSYSARVSVNGSTGVVTGYSLDSATSTAIDIKLSSDDIIGYLNNPLHPETIFGISGTRNEIELQNVVQLGGGGNLLPNYYTAFSGSDPFGTQLLDLNIRPVDAYFENTTLLELDSSRVFATLMTQIIKAFSVVNSANTSTGNIQSLEPLLKVQQGILRALEICLAVLGIFILCCAWPLRPRTCLSSDPSSLRFIATLVARNKALDTAFTIRGLRTGTYCRNSHFRLRQEPGPVMHIDIAPAGQDAHLAETNIDSGYEPMQLRYGARLGLLIILALYIAALGALYGSGTGHGYLANTKEAQVAWSFVPTALLVLIGYAVSGTVSATQAIAPLAMLKTERISGRRVMGFSPRNRSELTLPYHALFKIAYLPVLLTAIVALAYPAIKVVAANLYEPFERPYLRNSTANLSSPVFDFTQLSETDGGTESRLRNTAAIRTDWVQLPNFGVQPQPNVVRNLVFQNVSIPTGDDSADGRVASLELTALAVNMTCELFTDDDFSIDVFNGRLGTTFGVNCGTPECEEKMPYTTADDYNNKYIALRLANWSYWYTDPYATSNRRFYGAAGTLLNTPTIQVIISDFESLAGPVSNSSIIPDEPESAQVTSGMFNVSMPTTRAVSCTPILQNVRVNSTVERRVQAGLDGRTTLLPWAVTDFDPSSITLVDELNVTDPQVWRKMVPKGTGWGRSPFVNRDRTLVATNWTNESELNDDDIRPASGIASNFFELLASYELSQGRNATAVLDVKELASATVAVYGVFNAELLSHFRVATPLSTRDEQREAQAQLHTMQARVRPNSRVTFAVIGMLCVVWILLLLTFFTMASENILLDKPGMIRTQLSLFAGSKIVERLRGEDPDLVWDERFSLGWWGPKDTEADAENVRWGIDIGKLDATLQGYYVPKKKEDRKESSPSILFWRRNRPNRG